MQRSRSLSLTVASSVAGLLGIAAVTLGCGASTPPPELKNARTAYQQAASSPGATRAQNDISDAKKALDAAEVSFADDADSTETRDLSYVAERRAQSARAKANALTKLDEEKVAKASLNNLVAQRQSAQKTELSSARAALLREQAARADADRKTNDALAKIAGMTSNPTDRGLVLTLSGSVLFATGKSALLPSAQGRLNEAVAALKEDGRAITIVGHTDSVGSDESNMTLSRQRAESVRTYLVTHGIPEGNVKAEGAGESQPVADNATPEGRANNRRVEIILENRKTAP